MGEVERQRQCERVVAERERRQKKLGRVESQRERKERGGRDNRRG